MRNRPSIGSIKSMIVGIHHHPGTGKFIFEGWQYSSGDSNNIPHHGQLLRTTGGKIMMGYSLGEYCIIIDWLGGVWQYGGVSVCPCRGISLIFVRGRRGEKE